MRSALLVLVVLGCRRAPEPPPCGTVAGQFYTLATEQLQTATVEPATRRAVAAELPALRDTLAVACTEGGWSAAARTCMVAAQDHAAFQACEHHLTDDQRHALDRAALREPGR